jgi:Leucine-rich repeat (LRR) protein
LVPKNALRGDLGVAFANLTALETIDMLDNQLSGTIPSFIFEKNPGLSHVIVAGNSFTGPIPFEISGATKLSDLKLSGNQLTGTIPSEIGRLEQLSKHFISAFLPLMAWLVCILT